MKHVLVVIPAYFPDSSKGGSVSGCRKFVQLLDFAGFGVNVATIDTLNDGIKYREVDGIGVHYFPEARRLNFFAKSGFGVSISLLYWIYKRRRDFDLIYFRSIWNFVSLFGPLICLLTRKKFAFCASGQLSSWAMSQSSWKKKIIGAIFGAVLRRAEFIHFQSREEAEKQAFHPFRLVTAFILPQQVDESCLNSGFESRIKSPLIYSVSRIDPMKNLHYVVSELPSLQHFTYHYAHFGSAIEDKRYVQLKNDLDAKFATTFVGVEAVRNRIAGVSLCGHQSIDMVNSLCFAPSIFVLMSENEGLSNAALEAMARGSDVIVSSNCNMSEYEDLGGVTVIDPTTGSLKQILEERLINSDSIGVYGHNARVVAGSQLSKSELASRLKQQLIL